MRETHMEGQQQAGGKQHEKRWLEAAQAQDFVAAYPVFMTSAIN
ncbi:hypothetical protein ACLBWT_03615 [Paenibacillus sp. D51F]